MMHDNGCFVKSLRAELTALCYTQTAYSGRLPLRLVAEVGMGERFTAALRLGPRPMDDLGEDGKTQQWPQDRKRSFFIPIQKKGNAK